jgi:DNA-binding SARP family transcriptional activator
VEFRILGPLEVIDRGRPLQLGGVRQRALLALLLLNANGVVSQDRLLYELWGDRTPAAGSTALRVRVSQLRKALGTKEVLVTRRPGYLLRAEPDELDLHRFERLVDEAREAGPDVAADKLRKALALWRGSPLADLTYEPFARAAIERLEELRLLALERRIDADLALGREGDLVAELPALVEDHPLRERFRAQLMLALYRSGRQAEALDVYQAGRRALVEELGIDPSRALQDLERAVLHQDPALELEARIAAPNRSILVAPEGEAGLEPLLVLAAPLARRPVRDLILACIVSGEEFVQASEALAHRRDELLSQGLTARVAAFTSAEPGRDVVRLASEQDVDLVLLAGAIDLEAAIVLDEAPCDVGLLVGSELLVPRGSARPIVVPFGGADHDWAAIELATWIAQAQEAPLVLLGAAAPEKGRDASRLLASASLIVQRIAGIVTRTALVEGGDEGILRAAEDARLIVFGLSADWREKGSGDVRAAVARRAPAPTLFVRKGLRPGGLAPEASLTRFTWSLRR